MKYRTEKGDEREQRMNGAISTGAFADSVFRRQCFHLGIDWRDALLGSPIENIALAQQARRAELRARDTARKRKKALMSEGEPRSELPA